MERKLFKGTISLSRTHGGGHGALIHISIIDQISRTEFFDGFMSVEDFGNMITGLGFRPIEFEFRPDRVGMRPENKVEIVDRPKSYDSKTKQNEIDKALAPFEVDGWRADRSDLTNHHRRVGNDKVRVRFFRHVPVEPNET